MLGLPVHRLARKILGATVGVALGGGAAFGIAHLGVLKVLEKSRNPDRPDRGMLAGFDHRRRLCRRRHHSTE